jgi:hypothetical protein
MKLIISTMMAAGLALAACGGGKKTTEMPKPDDTTKPTGDTAAKSEGTPCAQEIALQCPDGQVDACLKTPAEGDTHKCVAK